MYVSWSLLQDYINTEINKPHIQNRRSIVLGQNSYPRYVDGKPTPRRSGSSGAQGLRVCVFWFLGEENGLFFFGEEKRNALYYCYLFFVFA